MFVTALAMAQEAVPPDPKLDDVSASLLALPDPGTVDAQLPLRHGSGLIFSGRPQVPLLPSSVHLFLPGYTQGIFCDFEDIVNRSRKLRINFELK
jgi:hypothetical protein